MVRECATRQDMPWLGNERTYEKAMPGGHLNQACESAFQKIIRAVDEPHT